VRLLLDQLKDSGLQSWTDIASSLGLTKQTLTGFRKKRILALEAEAVLRLCSRFGQSLQFEGQAIGSTNPPTLRLTMEFDESFQLAGNPKPSAVWARKPPGRVSYIGVRVEQISSMTKK